MFVWFYFGTIVRLLGFSDLTRNASLLTHKFRGWHPIKQGLCGLWRLFFVITHALFFFLLARDTSHLANFYVPAPRKDLWWIRCHRSLLARARPPTPPFCSAAGLSRLFGTNVRQAFLAWLPMLWPTESHWITVTTHLAWCFNPPLRWNFCLNTQYL